MQFSMLIRTASLLIELLWIEGYRGAQLTFEEALSHPVNP